MTLVTIDLGDVAGGHHPDDHVIIRAENFRESHGGGITSTAEVKIPLVDGVGQAEVEPGPVVIAFRCRAVADTREKRGVVPESGPVGIEDVIGGAFEYTPPVVNRGLDLIEGARDEALGQVAGAVAAELGEVTDRLVPLVEPPNLNLVNPDTTTGGLLHETGVIVDAPDRQVTDWIPVVPGSDYVSWSSEKVPEGVTGGHRLVFFNAAKQVLPGQDLDYRQGQIVHHWTAPATAEFVRIGMSPMPVPNPPLDELLIFNEGTELWDPDAPVDTSWWDGKVLPPIEGACDEVLGQVSGAIAAELDYFEDRMVPAEPENLVDPDQAVSGLMDTSGQLSQPGHSARVTHHIPVTPGESYVSRSNLPKEGGNDGGHRLLFFDADKVVIQGQDTAYLPGSVIHHWVAPPTAAYVRIGVSPMPWPAEPIDQVLVFAAGTSLPGPDAQKWWDGKVLPPVKVGVTDLDFAVDGKIPSTVIAQTPEDAAALAALIDQRAEEKVAALLSYLDKPLVYPAGFAEVPVPLVERFTGVITHDFDFDTYRNPVGATHLYFDGSRTSGDGSQQNPYHSWSDLTDAANATSGDIVVHVLNDFSDRLSAPRSTEMVIDAKRVSIISESPSGESWLTAASEALNWAQDGTVWTASRSGVYAVFSTTVDEHGVPIPLHSAATLEECRTTPGSWWTDSTLVAVNSPSMPTPQSHHIALAVRGAAHYFVQNGGELYIENVSFLAGHTIDIRGDSTGMAIFNRVKFIGGNLRPLATGTSGNGLNLTDVKTTLSFGCIAAHTARDGFNYHYLNTPVEARRSCLAFEYDCLAYNLGPYSTAGNNNATTAHEGISVLRVGTVGRGMSGPALADVNGCLSVNYQCEMTGGSYNYLIEEGEMWLHDCVSIAPVIAHTDVRLDGILHGAPIIR